MGPLLPVVPRVSPTPVGPDVSPTLPPPSPDHTPGDPVPDPRLVPEGEGDRYGSGTTDTGRTTEVEVPRCLHRVPAGARSPDDERDPLIYGVRDRSQRDENFPLGYPTDENWLPSVRSTTTSLVEQTPTVPRGLCRGHDDREVHLTSPPGLRVHGSSRDSFPPSLSGFASRG